ncbi:MAG TPA: chemotaxis response regulator protein-glutamate methylesterase [Spirochaetia bacterium]|nr:chemotaxis response regulator protein-glutamate methylesterase [Spirochaetia bacterium]
MTGKHRIRVLVVDDSALVRDILEKGLSGYADIDVVGKAPDVYVARDKIVFLNPDVITLDVEMPRMDGVEFLKRLMPQYPLPVIMVSSMTREGGRITLEALEAGAVDFVPKPASNVSDGLRSMIGDLAEKIRVAAHTDVSRWLKRRNEKREAPPPHRQKAGILSGSTDKVVAIGASTGGTVALHRIISSFPPDMPGTVVVQHMPPVFTKMFAESLDNESAVEVKEAEDGDRIIRGRVLVAPGDFHMQVRRSGGQYLTECYKAEKVNGHSPSVDVLFSSVAKHVGENAVGALLTGMGSDGAAGLLEMRRSGSRCFAQDEETSVVFGMPQKAWENGGAEKLVPVERVTSEIMAFLKAME